MDRIYQYPVQDTLPAGVQFGNFGVDGKQGFRIIAPSSGSIAMVQRVPLPQSATMSVELHAVIQNHLVAANNGREGVGFQIRGLRHEDTGARVVYSNGIGVNSEPDKWHNENRGEEWHRINTIEEIPQNLGIDSLDVMILVKASSGYIDVSQVGCRNHNARFFSFETPGPTTGLQTVREDVAVATAPGGGILVTKMSRNAYLGVISIDVLKGERVSLQARYSMNGSFTGTALNGLINSEIGVAMKMRRRSGQYDTYPAANKASGTEFQVDNDYSSTTFRAEHEYTQCEILLFAKGIVLQSTLDASFEHQGVLAEITVRGAVTGNA